MFYYLGTSVSCTETFYYCKLNYFFSIVFFQILGPVNAGVPTVSWLFRGSAASNYTLVVNTGTTLVLGCLARAGTNKGDGTFTPAFVVTRGSAPLLTATASRAANPAANPVVTGLSFALTSTGGTLIYDSINGHAAGFDHFITSVSLPLITTGFASAYMQIYNPFLRSTDAGSYFCTFYDGSVAATGVAADSFTSSTFFQLTVQTLSGAGSGSSRSAPRSKALEYSLALLGASKILL